MKLLSIKNGQCIRFMSVSPDTGQTLYGINLVRAFESRYGFYESPKKIEEFNLSNGITFKHGIFRNKYVIDRAMIYNNGVLAEGALETDICFDFISDVVEWAANEAGIIIAATPNEPELYNSTVYIELEINLEKRASEAISIGRLISEKLLTYGNSTQRYELVGLHFHAGAPNGPTPFRIERAAGTPFASNQYFSTSPLKTKDHLEVLQAIETAFRV